MFKWIIEKFEEWKFEREFQKKKRQLLKADPFIYDINEDDKKN